MASVTPGITRPPSSSFCGGLLWRERNKTDGAAGCVMLNAKAFLSALQLADSFFPTGMYAHSHGLEAMVSRKLVITADEVASFLDDQFAWSVVPGDGVALLNAHAAADSGDLDLIVAIDRLLWALKLPTELRTASGQLGRRLMSETAPALGYHRIYAAYAERMLHNQAPGNGAVALSVAAQAKGIPAENALLVLCHSHAVSVLGAAMRLLPLSHTDAQNILGRLQGKLPGMIEQLRGVSWEDMTSFTPLLDICSIVHETDDLRMFAS